MVRSTVRRFGPHTFPVRAALAWLLLAGTAAAAPPPLAAFARLPALEDAAVSPDGVRVAMSEPQGNDRVILIQTLAGQPLAKLNAGDRRVGFLDWADPDHLLIMTRSKMKEAVTAAGTLAEQEANVAVSYDLRSQKPVALLTGIEGLQNAVSSIPRRIRHEGRPAVAVTGLGMARSDRPEFGYIHYRVDLNTGRGVALDRGTLDTGGWLIRPDGELVARTVTRPEGDWILQTRKGQGWTDLARTPRAIAPPTLLGFGRDGRSLLVRGGPEGGSGLREIALETGAWSEPLPGAVGAPPSFFDRSRDGRLLAAVSETRHDPLIYDPALKTAWAVARKSFPGKQLTLRDVADDRRTLILGVADPGGPSTTYVLSLDEKRAEALGSDYPELAVDALASVRELSFKAADGTELTGVTTLPRGREAKGLPLVVLVRSASGTKHHLSFDWFAQALASRGYAVLQVDSRDAEPGRERLGDGQWGDKLQTDLADGARHLAAQGLADPARVCIVGLGGGSYSALAGVTVHSGPFRCAVALDAGPEPSIELSQMQEHLGGVLAARRRNFERLLGTAKPGDPRLAAISPVRQAGKGRAPVLLLRGQNNLYAPAEESRKMLRALEKAGRKAQLIEIPEGDSTLSRAAPRLRTITETVSFLEANNPPG